MKNRLANVLVILTVLFLGLTAGFFLGRNVRGTTVDLTSLEVKATTPSTTEAHIEGTLQPASAGNSAAADATTGGKVNVNTATLAELVTLPGIGEVLGQRIIDYREENGPFTALEDLANVSGIGTKRLEGLWDYATVGE